GGGAGEKGRRRGRKPPWVRWTDNGPELEPGPAAAVRMIYHLAGEGMSTKRIAAKLNALGVPPIGATKKSTEWRQSYVAKLLRDRMVLGELEDCTGAVHKAFYPPLLAEKTLSPAPAVPPT